MTLKQLAKKYYYKEKLSTRNKAQLIFNFLSDIEDDDCVKWGKAMRSFETYLTYYKKQDLLIKKGINPKKHKEYRLVYPQSKK